MKNSWGKGATGFIEKIRRDRIRIAVAAWAYEHSHKPPMCDSDYDTLSQRVQVNINVATGNYHLDRFFQRHFTPHSGLWIHRHPTPTLLENIYARNHYKPKRRKRRR